tara:strand:- start:2255 stop:2599 length:345 start_codon:yes stop_codon:yes gene_type:complete
MSGTPKRPITNLNVSKEGVVDLSEENQTQSTPPQSTESQSGGVLDFLSQSQPSTQSTSPISNNPLTQVSENSELKTKMRDLSGKMENMDNELYRLLHKIELLEQKISRFENRGI